MADGVGDVLLEVDDELVDPLFSEEPDVPPEVPAEPLVPAAPDLPEPRLSVR